MTRSVMHPQTTIANAIYCLFLIGATVWFVAAGWFVSLKQLTQQDYVGRIQDLLCSMFSAVYLLCFVVINCSCLPFHYALLHVIDGGKVSSGRRWKKAAVMQSVVFAASFVILVVLF